MASKTLVKSQDDTRSGSSIRFSAVRTDCCVTIPLYAATSFCLCFDRYRERDILSESGEGTVTESLQEEDVYEGVEKKLILMYSGARNVSIRKAIKEEVWNKVVEAVDAKVLSVMRGEHADAYLLSESSLFVFDDKIYLKTCGTTRIFNSVKVIVTNLSEEIPGKNLTRVAYSRPTYRFPDRQLKGYGRGFEKEVELLKKVTMEVTERSWESTIHNTGDGVTFHSSSLFLSGITQKHMVLQERTENGDCNKGSKLNDINLKPVDLQMRTRGNMCMDLAMFDMDQSKLKDFFGEVNVREKFCIGGFLPMDSPGLQIDDYNFQPCGYSLNALDGKYYWCVHVTPEAQYSYFSFETNHPSASEIYQKLKDFYSPERAIVLWADEKGSPTFYE